MSFKVTTAKRTEANLKRESRFSFTSERKHKIAWWLVMRGFPNLPPDVYARSGRTNAEQSAEVGAARVFQIARQPLHGNDAIKACTALSRPRSEASTKMFGLMVHI